MTSVRRAALVAAALGPAPAAEVLYLAGPLEGQDAEPGRTGSWSLYRDDAGRIVYTSTGDREIVRTVRGLPSRPIYVLQRSRRTGHWVYVWSPFLPAFLAANHWSEAQAAGPAVASDVQECRAHDLAQRFVSKRSRETPVIGALFPQVSGSASDRGSDDFDPRGELEGVLGA